MPWHGPTAAEVKQPATPALGDVRDEPHRAAPSHTRRPRIGCYACAAERLVAFACKGRGVCASCIAVAWWRSPPTCQPSQSRRTVC
jgi:hypothetical protein